MERELKPTRVPVNIYRTEERLMVAALLPGLQPEDISIELDAQGQLQLRSALRGKLKDWKDVLLEEWQAGGSSRSLELPVSVDGSAGHATYENGVLVIVLPIASSSVPGRFAPLAGQGH